MSEDDATLADYEELERLREENERLRRERDHWRSLALQEQGTHTPALAAARRELKREIARLRSTWTAPEDAAPTQGENE